MIETFDYVFSNYMMYVTIREVILLVCILATIVLCVMKLFKEAMFMAALSIVLLLWTLEFHHNEAFIAIALERIDNGNYIEGYEMLEVAEDSHEGGSFQSKFDIEELKSNIYPAYMYEKAFLNECMNNYYVAIQQYHSAGEYEDARERELNCMIKYIQFYGPIHEIEIEVKEDDE